MCEYREHDLLRLAKRYHNTRRTYLLVNPLQGKHMPVLPSASLGMMRALGERLAAEAGPVDLVIGFAETATAVGAAVASVMGQDCHYIHTTRETAALAADAVAFQEEHSHATDQFLSTTHLRAMLSGAQSVAFVDDEISTGRTLLNIIGALRAAFPEMTDKRIWAASIINRLSDERMADFRESGVDCCCLLHLPLTDYSAAVAPYAIRGADAPGEGGVPVRRLPVPPTTTDPRQGVGMRRYQARCETLAAAVISQISRDVAGKTVTVLGTEEAMYPAILLGEALEKSGLCRRIDTHATTRSPIGLCAAEGYPIPSGYRLRSFYDAARTAYIYDLLTADVVLVYTDSPDGAAVDAALADLSAAAARHGCGQIILVQEECHVRDL